MTAKADAIVRRAADDLAELLHRDFVYVNASGMKFGKADYIETYCTSGRVVFTEQRISDLAVSEFAGFAVATLAVHDKFTTSVREIQATYRSLCVFSNDKGQWLWTAGQTMATG